MDWQCHVLTECGYEIVSIFGRYCRATHNNRDVLLYWNGEQWLAL